MRLGRKEDNGFTQLRVNDAVLKLYAMSRRAVVSKGRTNERFSRRSWFFPLFIRTCASFFSGKRDKKEKCGLPCIHKSRMISLGCPTGTCMCRRFPQLQPVQCPTLDARLASFLCSPSLLFPIPLQRASLFSGVGSSQPTGAHLGSTTLIV